VLCFGLGGVVFGVGGVFFGGGFVGGFFGGGWFLGGCVLVGLGVVVLGFVVGWGWVGWGVLEWELRVGGGCCGVCGGGFIVGGGGNFRRGQALLPVSRPREGARRKRHASGRSFNAQPPLKKAWKEKKKREFTKVKQRGKGPTSLRGGSGIKKTAEERKTLTASEKKA